MFPPIFNGRRKRELIIAALTEGPAYGLEVIDRVKRNTGGRVVLTYAVYPILRELEREGVARCWEGPPLPGRDDRPMVYYALVERPN